MKFYRIKLHDELLLIYSGGICLQPLFRTKFKRFHKRKAIIISIIGLMIVFLVMINWWFIIYLKQIESIDEISLQVKQSATVDLPKTVKAKLRNNEYKTVDVSRIIVDNELLEEYEVRKSIYKVQTLPSKVLERLLEGKVTIEYIHYQYEFFAESFAFYFDSEESKRTLLEYAPRTYNFIDKHVN